MVVPSQSTKVGASATRGGAADWLAECLTEAIARHGVPGASMAVFANGAVQSVAAGQLNLATGVEATPDSVFQIGSITKPYTATQVMSCIEQGMLDLETPIAEIIPGFRLGDPEASSQVTVRQLLTHTSGVGGDAFADAGSGDDALDRAVAAYAFLGQDAPQGSVYSYCNAGYVILGRVIEALTGKTWDAALREQVLEPLGVRRTVTLPEEALGFRVAIGHAGDPVAPVPKPGVPRSVGPAAGLCATAEDVIAFACMHLRKGLVPSGARVLGEESVLAMQRRQVDKTMLSGKAEHWGLGWMLFELTGARAFGHFGGTIGQHSFLIAIPEHDFAIALLTNGGLAADCYRDVVGTVLSDVCGVSFPEQPVPAEMDTPDESVAGTYQNHGGRRLTVEVRDGRLVGVLAEPMDWVGVGRRSINEFELLPWRVDEGRFVARAPKVLERGGAFQSVVFLDICGEAYVHIAGEAMRRVGSAC